MASNRHHYSFESLKLCELIVLLRFISTDCSMSGTCVSIHSQAEVASGQLHLRSGAILGNSFRFVLHPYISSVSSLCSRFYSKR